MTPLPQRRRARHGFSYLEVMLATLVLALCILPAARYLPDLLAAQRDTETHYQLSVIAQEKLEAALNDLAATFAARDEAGDLAAEGHPGWRYHLVVTLPAAGNGRYATVRAEAWADADGDAAIDDGEEHVRFDTLQANFAWSP